MKNKIKENKTKIRLKQLANMCNLTQLVNSKNTMGTQICLLNHQTTLPPREVLSNWCLNDIVNEGGFIEINYATHKIFILGFKGDLKLIAMK